MSATGSDRGRLLVSIVAIATFLSLIWAASNPIIDSIRNTIRLQPLGYHQRRVRQLGPFYSSLTQLRTQVPPDQPMALITAGANIDAALFANYYLYPQPLRIYPGRAAYRNSAGDPSRPRTVVEAGDVMERTTYAAMRNQDLRSQPRLSTGLPLSEPRAHFLIPLAASIDGPEPDTYVLEGTLQNPGVSPAVVDMTFFPSGRSVHVTLPPRSSRVWYDLIFQQFGAMEIGWLEVQSSAPVAGAFSFVNRGLSDVVPLPVEVHPGSPSGVVPAGRDTKLWLLNLRDQPTAVAIGPEVISLKAHDLVVRSQQGPLPIVTGDGICAFVSTRDAAGRTRFLWPR